jgi:anti-sigma B factor antagonist
VAAATSGDCARTGPAADGQPGPSRHVPPAPPLTIETRLTAGTATVVIRGELDIATTPLLAERLAEVLDRGPQRLVFDMTQVTFVDCAAIRLVVGAGQALPRGRRSVIRPSAAVLRILDITGMDIYCELE